FGGSHFVAARREDRQPIVGRDPYLMREDASVDRARLLHFLAGRKVGVDPIYAQRAWIVERDQDVLRGDVRGHVDRPSGQPDRLTVLGERASGGGCAKRGWRVVGPRRAGPGGPAAGTRARVSPCDVRPGVSP